MIFAEYHCDIKVYPYLAALKGNIYTTLIKHWYLDAAAREIFGKYGKFNTDTGLSAEAQIALFSYRIVCLTRAPLSSTERITVQKSFDYVIGKRRALSWSDSADRDITETSCYLPKNSAA